MKIGLALVALLLTTTFVQANTKGVPDVRVNLKSWTPSAGTSGIGFGASKRRRPVEPAVEPQERQTR